MKQDVKKYPMLFFIFCLLFFSLACSLSSGVNETPAQTPIAAQTHTATPPIAGIKTEKPASDANRCENLSGEFEVKVLVGPADAVGLEPVAVGSLPFSVIKEGELHLIQGGGVIFYEDVLVQEWGTYTVKFDMEGVINGICEDSPSGGMLYPTIEMSGEQMVEVRSEGFSNDYPWSGTHSFDLTFPIEEDASAEGEGWVYILHLIN